MPTIKISKWSDIRRWREMRGFTARSAAKSLRVSLTTYQDWETGHNSRTNQPHSKIIMDRAARDILEYENKCPVNA